MSCINPWAGKCAFVMYLYRRVNCLFAGEVVFSISCFIVMGTERSNSTRSLTSFKPKRIPRNMRSYSGTARESLSCSTYIGLQLVLLSALIPFLLPTAFPLRELEVSLRFILSASRHFTSWKTHARPQNNSSQSDRETYTPFISESSSSPLERYLK